MKAVQNSNSTSKTAQKAGGRKSIGDRITFHPVKANKRSLVPLKVDFEPIVKNGALKRSGITNTEKRRVSFNKELYIRYRTTSEESSNSTLKEKRKCNLTNDIAIFSPSRYNKSYSYNKDKFNKHKCQKSEMEKKFDQLLNNKCSWSYRSQKVISGSNEENSTLQLQSTEMTIQLQNNYEEFNDALSENNASVIESENWGNNIGKISYIKTPVNESVKNTSNKHLMHKKKVTRKDTSKKMSKNKISKNNSIQVTVPSSSTRLQNAIKHAESSSNSSSDDEIFQTRFSQSRATLNKQNESNIDDIYMIEPDVEMIPPEGNDLKKDNQKRKSPIIIQAKAHKEENKDMIESRREVKELKTSNKGAGYTDSQQIDFLSELSKKLDSVSADSLSVEVNTPNTDIGSSSIEPVNQNSELLNGNNLNNPLYKTSEEMSDQILLTNINNSVNQNVENLDANSCDVIQNFLNGSLNVNEYKNEEILENKNYFMKALQSVDACSKTSKAIVETPHVDLTDISGKNIFTKRYAHQPQKGQKRQKSDRKNSNKTEDFTEISSQNQKMNSKIVKKPQIKRKRSTIVRKRDESVDSSNSEVDEICHKNANATQELNLLNNLPCYKDDTVINSIHSFDSYDEIETATNNSMKINNVRNNKNKSNTYKTNKTLMPRRHTRNSSLIASKKIKEIERLENLFDGDEIYVDSASEKDYMVVSENTMQNKEKNILEDSFKNGKENSKKHFIKGLTSYVKHNDKNFAENEFCFQMNNKTGPIKSKRSNKKSKILIHNKLETFNAITDKCNIKNKSIYTDLMKNLNGSDEHISENDLQENVEVSSELHSDRRKNQIKECVNKENKVLNHYNDVFNKDLTLKYDPFKPQKNIPQCRYKTWDDLENELLGGFNNKFNNEGNISKTVTIKKKQLFQKEMTKEENLLTVSNTSMTQMISKSRDGNYNMRYEIQNIKSKYMESVPSIYKFQSTNSFVKRDASKSTSKCILEKTLAAMEKCTANFIKPQVNKKQTGRKKRTIICEEMSCSDNENEVQQFHADIKNTVKEKKSIFNKKVNFKSQAKGKKFKINNNMAQLSDVYDSSQQTNAENFYNNDLYEMDKKCSTTLNQNVDKCKTNSENQPVMPYSHKADNPWNMLLEKLNLEDNTQSINRIDEDENCNTRKESQREYTNKYVVNLKNNTRNKKMFISDSQQVIESDDTELTNSDIVNDTKYGKSESSTRLIKNKTNLMMQNENECRTLTTTFNLNLTEDSLDVECGVTKIPEGIESNNTNKVDNIQKHHLVSSGKRETLQESMKIKENKSQKYKISMTDEGLKLKRQFSESYDGSDSTNATELTKSKTKDLKNKDSKGKNNREKYNSYLKKLFEKDVLHNSKGNKNIVNTQCNVSTSQSSVKNMNKNLDASIKKNEKENVKKPNLIAEDNDDIFSISSSGSDNSYKKIPGSGLLCDLFDE